MDYLWITSFLKYSAVLVSSFLIIPYETIEPYKVQPNIRPKQVALSTSKFAIALYKEISKTSRNDNIFFSPLSVSTALGMVLAGAGGITAKEIKYGLYFRRKEQNLQQTFGHVISVLNQTKVDSTVYLANRIFIQEHINVQPSYSKDLLFYYKTKMVHVDFKNKDLAKTKINEWISEETCRKIPQIVDVLDTSTFMVIVNAIYFKGDWAKPFNQINSSSVFYSGLQTELIVEMMSRIDDFNFGDNLRLKCKLLELPYSDNHLSMFILLPDRINGIRKLEKKLSVKMLKKIIKNMRLQHVSVLLPKFKLKEKYSMPQILTKLGISSLFSDSADLSGIFRNDDVYVSGLIHQATIEVNENGTEAAGVNVISIKPRILSVPISFNANHPFFFFIRHNPTDLILFAGKVQKPNSIDNIDI